MGDELEVRSVYSNFSNAFERVNNSILIQKLAAYGLAGTLLN